MCVVCVSLCVCVGGLGGGGLANNHPLVIESCADSLWQQCAVLIVRTIGPCLGRCVCVCVCVSLCVCGEVLQTIILLSLMLATSSLWQQCAVLIVRTMGPWGE